MTAPAIPGTGRVLGLDLGQRRIGVAATDSDRRLATAVTTVHRCGDRQREHRAIAELVAEYEATAVVVGLPLSLSGGVGPAARATLDEVTELETRLEVPVVTHDERYTTVTASAALRTGGRRARQQRSVIDQVAAAVMLQSWADGQGRGVRS